jgi:hypothetical protein
MAREIKICPAPEASTKAPGRGDRSKQMKPAGFSADYEPAPPRFNPHSSRNDSKTWVTF